MVSRKTQYGWMALGGLLCLFGLFLVMKLHEGGQATAQTQPPKPLPPKALLAQAAQIHLAATEKMPPADPKPEASIPIPLADVVPPLPSPGNAEAASAPIPPPPLPTPTVDVPSPLPTASAPPPLPGSVPAPAIPPPAPVDVKPESPPLPGAPTAPPPPAEVNAVPLPPPAGTLLPPLSGTELPPKKPEPPAAPTIVPPPDVKPVVNLTPAPEPPTPPVALPAPIPMDKLPPSTEPPLAPPPGSVVIYQTRAGGETMRDISKRTLGSVERWVEIHSLNPALKPEVTLNAGTTVKLPPDACIHDDEAVQPLPSMRPKASPRKPKAPLPLTGSFAANLDDRKTLLLPRSIRDQLGNCETVLLSPGSDACLWLTNQSHLDRLAERLEHSPAREVDVRIFKRLYFAQTEKIAMSDEGRVTVPDKLAQFAGLHQEVVLVGIDDHFELWDAAKWRQYTQQKSAAARAAMADHD